jgi:hypothetical protein
VKIIVNGCLKKKNLRSFLNGFETYFQTQFLSILTPPRIHSTEVERSSIKQLLPVERHFFLFVPPKECFSLSLRAINLSLVNRSIKNFALCLILDRSRCSKRGAWNRPNQSSWKCPPGGGIGADHGEPAVQLVANRMSSGASLVKVDRFWTRLGLPHGTCGARLLLLDR